MSKWLWCVLICIGTLPVHAQRYKFLGSILRRHPAPITQQTSLALSVDRTVFQARTAPLEILSKAVFKIQEKDWIFRWQHIEGTAFALEETYQGKKYLWGVTASHYLFKKPSLKLPNQPAARIYFEIQGSAGMNDISLFLLPDHIQPQVYPLQLADKPVEQGEDLFSIGYWNGKIHVDEHRNVQEITPTRITTSLKLNPHVRREGTCGSPVLNRAGQVVGVHAGNSPRRQTGGVIPMQHIRNALAAYHQRGHFEQELLFQGVSLGTIHLNECVSGIDVFAGTTQLRSWNILSRVKQVDYAHLEKLADITGADRIVFFIDKNPLSSREKDQYYYERSVIYDLTTGTITHTSPQKYTLP